MEYSKSKTRNMEKSPAANARPSQTNMVTSVGKGASRRGTPRISQRTPGKVVTK